MNVYILTTKSSKQFYLIDLLLYTKPVSFYCLQNIYFEILNIGPVKCGKYIFAFLK